MKMRSPREVGVFRTVGQPLLAFQTLLLLLFSAHNSLVADDSLVFLGDANPQLRIEHQQQWGDFGWNTAAAAQGRRGSPMRIGEQTYERGLGHHASGEIFVPLNGQFVEFRSQVGVQWQGGGKGSVIFRVLVDGQIVFESDAMSDSDPARVVQVPVAGARELRLVADNAGDGIACDMANWANSRLVADSSAPRFGPATVKFNDSPAPQATADASGFSIIAAAKTPQVCVMESAGLLAVSIQQGEEVRLTVPVTRCGEMSRTMVQASIAYGQSAEVGMSLGGPIQWVALGRDQCVELSVTVESADAKEIVLLTRGVAGDTAVRWRHLRFARQNDTGEIPILLDSSADRLPPPTLPDLRATAEKELVEWDWRLQDGIGTPREPTTWQDAIQATLARADLLLQHLAQESARPLTLEEGWAELRQAYE
jgi:hypothetical protein